MSRYKNDDIFLLVNLTCHVKLLLQSLVRLMNGRSETKFKNDHVYLLSVKYKYLVITSVNTIIGSISGRLITKDKYLNFLTLNRMEGGGTFDAHPLLVFFCPSTLIFDTISVKFFDFQKIHRNLKDLL